MTVDGKRLDEHYGVKRFTTWGFEWTYEGDSPQQLALAMLVEHLRDNERAIRLSDAFMRKVVANLDNDWVLTGAEIDRCRQGNRERLSCNRVPLRVACC